MLVNWFQKHWGAVLTAALIVLSLWNGLRSIDFGFHWDELVHLETVKIALAEQTLLPGGFYDYPSFLFFLTVVARVGQRILEPLGVGQTDQDFIILGRSLFFVVTVAGAAFLYAAGRRISGTLSGLFAVITYLFSWQLTYHARWIAPDALLASIGALFIWTLVRRTTTPNARLARLGPYLVAGLAAGTKYQGAFLVLGALALDVLLREDLSLRQTALALLRGIASFIIAFVVITPGILLQPWKVYAAIRERAEHYAEGHGLHLGAQSEVLNTPREFGTALLRSFAFDFSSHVLWLSALIFSLAIIGALILGRKQSRLTLALLIGPFGFFLYSLTLVVFIIRNFLIFFPFITFFAAVAVGAVCTSRRTPVIVKWGSIFAIICYSTFGIINQTKDATAINQRGPEQLARMIADYIRDSNPSTQGTASLDDEWAAIEDGVAGESDSLCISSTLGVQDFLRRQGINVAERERIFKDRQVFLFLSSELDLGAPVSLDEWPGTRSRWYGEIGTREVDFSHYPRWDGDVRALVLTAEKIDFIGLDKAEQEALRISSACLVV